MSKPAYTRKIELTQSNQAQAINLNAALDCLIGTLVEGLRHGFFRCEISAEIGKGNRRELIVACGKSHKFSIPIEELQQH